MKVEYLLDGSPNCPLIRLFGTDPAPFAALSNVLWTLASGPGLRFAVDTIRGVTVVDGCVLVLVSGERDRGVSRIGDGKQFEWALTPPGWRMVGELAQPFLRDFCANRFQWLAGREARDGLERGPIAILLSTFADGRW